MVYFDAHGLWDLVLLWINGGLASAIALTLLLSSHTTAQRRNALTWYERAVRFVLTAAYAVLAVRVWLGWYYTPVEPTHVAVNALVLALVVLAHGDVAVIVRALRQMRTTREALLAGRKPS
ncbi:hypothetical protein ACM714_27565 [Pseudomonas aeruginosa]|nr:hypothetical protein [Pseudomonas aeruginosa]HCL3292894.1 hypothetical protein [Pseudomonas aeruginosa]